MGAVSCPDVSHRAEPCELSALTRTMCRVVCGSMCGIASCRRVVWYTVCRVSCRVYVCLCVSVVVCLSVCAVLLGLCVRVRGGGGGGGV